MPEIDEAVEVENFDLAEDMEFDFRSVLAPLQELETARMGLTSKLEALEKASFLIEWPFLVRRWKV